MDSTKKREALIAQIAESREEVAALQEHVRAIREGHAFRGSDRCGRFLHYIIEQAIAGRLDALKERVIGVEVFGRSPDYDTSEDAIVRVTASDVRKRLLQHYGRNGAASGLHISLPVGSYVPEIARDLTGGVKQTNSRNGSSRLRMMPLTVGAAYAQSEPIGIPESCVTAKETSVLAEENALLTISFGRRWFALATLIVVLNLALWATAWKYQVADKETPATLPEFPPASVLPWSVLLNSPHFTHLITSDPNIGRIQQLAGDRISVSDYANHNYIPTHNHLSAEAKRICLTMMAGDLTAAIDTQIITKVVELAKENAVRIEIQGARSLQFSSLTTDDNFVFLGSAFSDPWFSVFSDQLDFRIVPNGDSGKDTIQNVHPRTTEQAFYAPTAAGGATGDSFAVVALVGNPDQYGQVLLLAGLTAEGTEAAGKLVTDLPRLSTELQRCGISPNGPVRHFEMLLRVKTMAGSPSQYSVVACHVLPGAAR
jgi:hypothetical protein